MARPEKFNKEIAKDIIELYESGISKTQCANFVGINPRTISRWCKKGEESEDPEDEYYKFYKGMLKAKAKFIMYHQNKINNNEDWRASKYLLEVTDPDTYVLEKRLNVKSEETKTVTLTDEELLGLVKKDMGLEE